MIRWLNPWNQNNLPPASALILRLTFAVAAALLVRYFGSDHPSDLRFHWKTSSTPPPEIIILSTLDTASPKEGTPAPQRIFEELSAAKAKTILNLRPPMVINPTLKTEPPSDPTSEWTAPNMPPPSGDSPWPVDPDGVFRSLDLTKNEVPDIFRLLLELMSPPHKILENSDLRNFRVNFLGPEGTLPRISYTDFMESKHIQSSLRGKYVIIAPSNQDQRLLVQTPVGHLSQEELVGQILSNMVAKQAVRPLGFWSALLLDGLFLALALIAIVPATTRMSFPIFLLTTLSCTVLSVYLFDVWGLWYSLVAPLSGLSLLFLLLILYKLSWSEKLKWQLQREKDYLIELDLLKSNFIGLFSHDIKTPIAKIQAITDRLMIQNTNSEITQDLRNIHTASDELRKYINNVLNLLKVESNEIRVHFAPTDINSLLHKCIDFILPLAEEKEVTIDFRPEPLFAISGDSKLLTEVFINVLDNALKHSPPKSTLWIETKESNGFVSILFKDQGSGIPEDLQPHLWKKFSKHKSFDSGSGLGLYLIKYFIELHKGTVKLQSREGKGTDVTIRLPLDQTAQTSRPKVP